MENKYFIYCKKIKLLLGGNPSNIFLKLLYRKCLEDYNKD